MTRRRHSTWAERMCTEFGDHDVMIWKAQSRASLGAQQELEAGNAVILQDCDLEVSDA